jgi:hypothetical protein
MNFLGIGNFPPYLVIVTNSKVTEKNIPLSRCVQKNVRESRSSPLNHIFSTIPAFARYSTQHCLHLLGLPGSGCRKNINLRSELLSRILKGFHQRFFALSKHGYFSAFFQLPSPWKEAQKG